MHVARRNLNAPPLPGNLEDEADKFCRTSAVTARQPGRGLRLLVAVGGRCHTRAMNLTGEQLQAMAQRCEQFLESKWKGGYPDSLALCIVDSVQSTGVTYTSVGNVLDAYRRYRAERNASAKTDGTHELLKTFEELGGSVGWAAAIGNQNKTSTRAGAPLKAEAIRLAAQVMDAAGIRDTATLRDAVGTAELEKAKSEWLRIPGQRSGITWRYLLMLAGVPGVKPDRMIIRFVADTLGLPRRSVTTEFAANAVVETANALKLSPTELDHGIWSWQRRQR